jgi:hypothetical protein
VQRPAVGEREILLTALVAGGMQQPAPVLIDRAAQVTVEIAFDLIKRSGVHWP